MPVLVIHGTADTMVPFDPHAAGFASRIPGVELLAVEGGEHAAIFTHRKIVRRKVAEFLECVNQTRNKTPYETCEINRTCEN